MDRLFTTKEVCRADGVAKDIALRYARKHGVRRVGRDYLWTLEDIGGFVNRNRLRGRPKKRRVRIGDGIITQGEDVWKN